MRYRERVAIQEATEARSSKGSVTQAWAGVVGLGDIPATIVPSVIESQAGEMTVVQDRYNIVLAGRHEAIQPAMAVVDGDGRRYDIEQVDLLLGGRQTRLLARRVSI